MAREEFVMNLAKLLIAAAWADGELTNEEVNSMKDLLFTIPELQGEQWKRLEIYMDSPVTAEETQQLLAAVLEGIRSKDDKTFVLDALRKLFQCDATVSPEESALLEEIERAVAGVSTDLASRMAKALRSALNKRGRACAAVTRRDERFDDYIHNTIYYQLTAQMEESQTTIDASEADLRKLSLAAGLMARIAHVDAEISDEERRAMRRAVATDWGLSDREADLLVTISCDRTTRGLDYYRLSRGFFEHTTLDERKKFLRTLFRIADASEQTAYEEVEEIRNIAKSLKLSNDDFIKAKMSVPRKDRQGL